MISEKQSLLADDSEVSTISRPSFTRLLSRPFQCLPTFTKPQYFDYSDDEEFTDLPYTSSNVSSLQSSLTAADKLAELRKLMKYHGISVYIVPSEDEHQSEYTADADKRREFISGFTGSAGIAIITIDTEDGLNGEAALSTDGRYFLQAEKQLDLSLWKLLKQGVLGYPKWTQYCINKALSSKFSNIISCDPRVLSCEVGEFFDSSSKNQYHRQFQFVPLLTNLIDTVWGHQRPSRSLDPIYEYPLEYSGESANAKISRVREKMHSLHGDYLIITALDEIAWLLNLRADTDVDFSPVFFSYVIITPSHVTFYINHEKLQNPKLPSYLEEISQLIIKPYDDFYKDLVDLKSTVDRPIKSVILPTKQYANYALSSTIPPSAINIQFNSIVSYLKIYKNKTELFNCKIAQYKDSLAFIIFSSWLEHQLIHKKTQINEYQAACKMHAIRLKFPNFKFESYETISSSGANGAIIHYAPSKHDNAPIDANKIYLIDSGAQYLEGTTDITRTYKFGNENLLAEDKKFYTLVLKGHLAVSMAKFAPHSADSGIILDGYSRRPLWNEGLDFNHGTGHGVGAFGLVHEAPLYFLTTTAGPLRESLFRPGAIITIEPGYYMDGVKGFRIESELEIIQCDSSLGKTRNGDNFLGFKYLTKVPFCRKLIDKYYLDHVEINWINEYHQSIRNDFGDKLLEMGDKRAYDWLINETAPI